MPQHFLVPSLHVLYRLRTGTLPLQALNLTSPSSVTFLRLPHPHSSFLLFRAARSQIWRAPASCFWPSPPRVVLSA